jgi:diaminohydroxyphosphoribosylaminopyrimidine deaminase / 5-amino-6-(5-phosphoribosylamino)uracil reductase
MDSERTGKTAVPGTTNPASMEADERWMSQALGLARKGVGLASPNPTVGCVIIRDGQRVGSGFHQYDRRDHAEIVALREAGERARGATAYVPLEPCSHFGRTGPCVDALIAAGLGRVVIATADANPAVNGQGIEKLRAAGIEVTVGVLQEPAQRINDAFAKYIRTGLPFVTLKAAMSLDGRIAPPAPARKPGEIYWITGPESLQQVHRLRHSVDAVLTGIGTVLADDPLLTDRSGLPRRKPLLRVVLDTQLRLPLEAKLVKSADLDVLIFCSDLPENRRLALSAAGLQVKEIESNPGSAQPQLRSILQALGKMQITSLMIEAGSQVNSSFLDAGLVDRLYLFYAPHFLGPEAQPVVAAPPIEKPGSRRFALHRFGEDFAFEGWLNDPWQP